MNDGNLIPISDEQAKLGQELVGACRDAGGYLADILDNLPKNLLGLLIGDKVRIKRVENFIKLWDKAQKRLAEKGLNNRRLQIRSWCSRSSWQLPMKTVMNYKICGTSFGGGNEPRPVKAG